MSRRAPDGVYGRRRGQRQGEVLEHLPQPVQADGTAAAADIEVRVQRLAANHRQLLLEVHWGQRLELPTNAQRCCQGQELGVPLLPARKDTVPRVWSRGHEVVQEEVDTVLAVGRQ